MLAGEKIAELRKKKGLSTTKLGLLADVSQGTICRYEKGLIKEIPYDRLQKLAAALDCTVSDLIGGDPTYYYYDKKEKQPLIQQQTEYDADKTALLEWYDSLSSEQQKAFQKIITAKNR